MFDALRYRLGYRGALRAVRRRLASDRGTPQSRKVLVLLPIEEGAVRDAWAFVRSLDVRPADLVPVVAADRVAYAPDAFAGGVRTVGEKERDWRGLPNRKAAEALWNTHPDLALDLNPAFDLASAYLVGASPARFRVGMHSEEGEPFFDLLIAPTGGYAGALASLRRYLGAVEPPVVAFHD